MDNNVSKYTKEELKETERFNGMEDLLEALLEDDEEYSAAEAERKINKFMKRRV